MTDELEHNIGRDLQFIRVNGTLVGGLLRRSDPRSDGVASERHGVAHRMRIRLAVRPCSPVLAEGFALPPDPFLARALGPKPNAAVGWLFPKWFDEQGDVLPRLLSLAAGEEVSFLRDVSFDGESRGTPRRCIGSRDAHAEGSRPRNRAGVRRPGGGSAILERSGDSITATASPPLAFDSQHTIGVIGELSEGKPSWLL